jgi:hypothetical protein
VAAVGSSWDADGQRTGPAPGRLASAGFFGRYVFDGRTWHNADPEADQAPDIGALWLSVDIHDSDFATVRYKPSGPGSGTAYLGKARPGPTLARSRLRRGPTRRAKLTAWYPDWLSSAVSMTRGGIVSTELG